MLEKCMSSAEMKSVVFPRGLRAADNETLQKNAMIFDNLCWKNIRGGPFKCGLPDRFAEHGEDHWQSCLEALEGAFWTVHNKGKVVHVDPYPSNFMYRFIKNGSEEGKGAAETGKIENQEKVDQNESLSSSARTSIETDRKQDKVDVRIIDWDAAHSVMFGGNWSTNVETILKEISKEREGMGWQYFGDEVNPEHDLQYLKVLRALNRDEHEGICRDLASGDVGTINEAFLQAAQNISIKEIQTSDLAGYHDSSE